MITVVAIGKKHESWIIDGLERYQKRLKQPFDIEWVLLPHSSLEGKAARQEESERILKRTNEDTYLILLDETGKIIDSPAVAGMLNKQFTNSHKVVVAIGGAYGVSAALIHRADFLWSLSLLVFPHQLVRLILAEQVYRAQEISRGSDYHHV